MAYVPSRGTTKVGADVRNTSIGCLSLKNSQPRSVAKNPHIAPQSPKDIRFGPKVNRAFPVRGELGHDSVTKVVAPAETSADLNTRN